jgi:hypothetical protein
MTLVGRITLPRQFPGGGQPLQTMEQADRLLSVKCPPAFLRLEAVEGHRMVPRMVATSSIESLAPCGLSADQWAALHAVALA